MDKLRAPDKLNLDARNLADTWKKWKEEFTLYTDLIIDDDNEVAKVKMFLYLIGTRGREIYETMNFEQAAENRTLKIVLDAFDKYCNPKRNETVERYRFNRRDQGPDENLDKYVTELKILASTCNYAALHDSLIRDRLICGIRDSALRERLLRTPDLDLDKSLQLCRASELSKERIKTLEAPPSTNEIHALKQKGQKYSNSGARPKQFSQYKQTSYNKQNSKCCKYCGKSHDFKKTNCPAYGKKCRKCGKLNHFESMCKSAKGQKVKAVSDEEYESDDFFEIHTVTLGNINSVKSKQTRQIFATMNIIGNKTTGQTRFQLDSGATCNVITTKILKQLGIKHLEKTKQILTMYNKTTVKPLGKCTLKLINPKNTDKFKAEFVVVKDGALTPLLGNKAVQAMNLMTINYENIKSVQQGAPVSTPLNKQQVLDEYADVFEGTGKLEGKYHLEIDERVTPVVHPPRKVPIAIKDRLHEELQRLTKLEIITPVTTPTPWVSSLVTVVKPDKLRICLDPKHLNQGLKRSHYPLPTIEDLLPDLNKARIFSVVDAKNGFWHVELDDESSYLTTFNTPFGRYRWLRMPFGISSAPEEYQRRQDQAIEGLPGVRSIIDDILIFGEGDTDEEAIIDHDKKFRSLMERCRERNLKLNKDKLKLKLREVKFIGHLITNQGLKPDPEKIRAVMEMPKPTDVSGVRRIIGFVTYLSKFLPKLSDICEPLRKLTLKESEFVWLENHDAALDRIKDMVTSEPVLSYYNPNIELTLQSDASESGLGAAIMQHNHPIAYASRALSDTETRYAQIEKELLAVIFGLEKFHQYTYGRTVRVISDHKPLESIMKKPLHAAPKRLQRMLLRLQKYDIQLQYRPGKEMYLADTLSRAYLPLDKQEVDTTEFESINAVDDMPISGERIKELQEHTEADETLQEVRETIQHGWPENKSDVSINVSVYFDIRDELTVQNGLIFKGNRIVIPKTLRKFMMENIHASHIGVEGCLRRARESLFWPAMNAEIKDYIQRCETCRTYEHKQQKEPIVAHSVPLRPWAKIGTDLMTFQNRNYLVTVDYYSNFWEVDYLDDTRSETVIHKLRSQFARYGIPDECVSDNGPQFSSDEFKSFSRKWDFKHTTSSPLYPQSNGMVERAVQTVKNLMRKATYSRSDPYMAILDFRNTPSQGFNSSPAQRLMNRRTKTLLPTRTTLLQPDSLNQQNIGTEIDNAKQRQAKYYNRETKELGELKNGDIVRIQPNPGKNEWRKGTVKEKVNIRSYDIDIGPRTIRRNRRHLRKSHEEPTKDEHNLEIDLDEHATTSSKPTTPEHSDNKNSTNSTTNTEMKTITRSGRVVQTPKYLSDYIRH